MKIIKLVAENLKRLRCVEITPDGTTVKITGRNSQGKTSVLDSIWLTLGGGKAAKNISRPIRDGEKHASVTLDLGELKVTRSWTQTGTRLLVERANGDRVKSPQTLLDSLIGSLSFDPLAFAGLPAREQVATLLDLVELPFDPAKIEQRRADLYEERREINRDVKDFKARFDAMSKPASGLPAEEVSLADLLAEHKAAQLDHDSSRAATAAVGAAAERQSECTKTVNDLTARLQEAKSALKLVKQQIIKAKNTAEAASKCLPDLAEIEDRLAKIETTNTEIRAATERNRVAASLKRGTEQADGLTEKIKELDETKVRGLREVQMPIDGLSFDQDGVLYRGIPFAQCSASERLRVSMAMAMALNPKVRVIRVTDASLLDPENMALIEDMAGAHDFQVWLEIVGDGDAGGIVIEDGMVATVRTKKPS